MEMQLNARDPIGQYDVRGNQLATFKFPPKNGFHCLFPILP
jgi:hypothetical protein